MRLATLRLRIRNEIRSLSLLLREELASLLDEIFDIAAETLGAGPDAPLLDDGQETTSSTSEGSGAKEPDAVLPSKQRRSWAIWRAK